MVPGESEGGGGMRAGGKEERGVLRAHKLCVEDRSFRDSDSSILT